MDRRAFLRRVVGGVAACALSRAPLGLGAPERPNVLLITADDMNWDSLGVTGCTIPGISPNLDKLASQGMRFAHAHVTVAVCMPCREVLMTGRYPHRNGAVGFHPIRADVPTLQEQLDKAGYVQGILGKVPHLAPQRKFCWDLVVGANELDAGRSPELYYQHAKAFIEKAKAAGKPFFLMANSHDPHRPFVGSQQERGKFRARVKAGKPLPKASRVYKPEEIEVPGFLPDIPDVRKEVAQYFGSAHRSDETAGAVLRALEETGLADNTLVMFLSDHGMAFPFAKTNCYLNSTKTPWIVRWPGKVTAGAVDGEHFISGIDFMPTILEATGVAPPQGMDGRSFLPLLLGGQQEGRGFVYTVFDQTAGRKNYPMRCLQTRRFGYIFNPWSDGKTVFRNESQSGLSMKAMRQAAERDKAIAARVRLFLYRVREELYDFEKDPDGLHNLADVPKYRAELDRMRKAMLAHMGRIGDPQLPALKKQIGAEG